MAKQFRKTLSASSLTGDQVVDVTGNKIGKIEDLMVDIIDGRVAYAVLSFGGFLGIGDKLFAIPWSRLTVDEAEKRFVINVTKETLENAPGFDKDHWPDMDDLEYANGIYRHYGVTPYWT